MAPVRMDKEGYELTLHAGDIQYYASGLETWQYWFTTADPLKTVTHLTVGGGGTLGKVDANISRPTCSMRKSSGAFYHMKMLEVGATSLEGRPIDVNGQERDSFEQAL